uniref:Uncharacterized protein n=1 Tax=Megaselia scalaris TaxID=36166 RepID=T1GMX2_MEGSC
MADKISRDRGFHYYCEKHRNISVSELLKKLAKLQSFHVELKLLTDKYKDILEAPVVSDLRKLEKEKLTEISTDSPSTNMGRGLRSSSKRQVDSSDEIIKKKKTAKEYVYISEKQPLK